MNKLKKFFKENKIKPTPWAIKHGIAPPVISRYLNGKGISPANAEKIEQATDEQVSRIDLLYREKKQGVADNKSGALD